jgi:hypothetical protein
VNDLATLLDLAAGPADAHPGNPQHDLRRGHRALQRTRVRRSAAGLVGVAAAGVLGVGLVRHGDERTGVPVAVDVQQHDPIETTGFVLTSLPVGWRVSGETPDSVTLSGPGTPSSGADVFTGKITVLYDENAASGTRFQVGARDFWVGGDSGYTTVSAFTRTGEPRGMVRVQYPDDAGWTREQAADFLSGVRVLDAARPGVG